MRNTKTLRKVGPLLCVAVVVALLGVSHLDAKKPPKPPKGQEWQVAIPGLSAAEPQGCNLYGVGDAPGGYVVYQNGADSAEVEVSTNVDRESGEAYTVFSLPLGHGAKHVRFRDLGFMGCQSYCLMGGTGPCRCQVFPETGAGADCCVVDCCTPDNGGCGATGYEPMNDFMVSNDHPTADYDHFSLRFIVYADIESMDPGDELTLDADLWRLNFWNTDQTLVSGWEDDHNIVGAYWIPLEDVVVVRSQENEWTVTVDQCGATNSECLESQYGYSGRWIVFWETYYQQVEEPIGNSGKTRLGSEYRWALGAGTPFKFVTRWSRN